MTDQQYTIDRLHFDEQIVAGHRLGRHYAHDSRSDAYPYRAAELVTVQSVEHARHIPILDQGDLGSCEGNATTGCAGTSPVFDALPASHPVLNEDEAVAIYSAATVLDSYPGQYPPTDTGTDNTSAMKAAQKAGLIAGYTHAATVADVVQALMAGPVLFGISWYSSFDEPDSNGLVSIAKSAYVRGGHAIVCRRYDDDRKLVGPDNSWGASWGVAGSFWFSLDTLDELLNDQGEATVPVPLTAPVPVPVPVPVPPAPAPPGPVPDPALAAYLADQRLVNWAAGHHVGDNEYAARAYARLRAGEVGV